MIISPYDRHVIETTLQRIETETGFEADDLRSRKRNSELIIARFITVFVIKKHTRLTLKCIGREFGRDHSSILHALDEVKNWLSCPQRYISEVIQLERISTAVKEEMSRYLEEIQMQKLREAESNAGE
jgi:chromosomal replication initiation ATPase DnaA